jgi:hypothetical protein
VAKRKPIKESAKIAMQISKCDMRTREGRARYKELDEKLTEAVKRDVAAAAKEKQ